MIIKLINIVCVIHGTVQTLTAIEFNMIHPLQLLQLQLFWEGFPPGLGVYLWEFLTILPEVHL